MPKGRDRRKRVQSVEKDRRTPAPAATGPTPTVDVASYVEVICAVHLSSYVEGPFQERGGLMVVGPPSVLKSTLLEIVSRNYNDAVSVSDINARSLNDLRDQIASKTIRTLVVPEYAKLWDRHSFTAKNVEGTIRALVAEGFSNASFEDQRINRLRARATFLSAMTPDFQGQRFKGWEDSGFNRRFLWSLVRLNDPHMLERAVELWELIDFRIRHIPLTPQGGTIPNTTTQEERGLIRRWVKYQPGGAHAQQFALLVKVFAVLKWWYKWAGKNPADAMVTLERFAESLGKEGAELVL